MHPPKVRARAAQPITVPKLSGFGCRFREGTEVDDVVDVLALVSDRVRVLADGVWPTAATTFWTYTGYDVARLRNSGCTSDISPPGDVPASPSTGIAQHPHVGPHCACSMLAGRRAPRELLEGQWGGEVVEGAHGSPAGVFGPEHQPAVRPLVAARCPAATRDPRHRRATRVGHLRIRCRSGQRQDMGEHAAADRTGGGSKRNAEPSPRGRSASAGGAALNVVR